MSSTPSPSLGCTQKISPRARDPGLCPRPYPASRSPRSSQPLPLPAEQHITLPRSAARPRIRPPSLSTRSFRGPPGATSPPKPLPPPGAWNCAVENPKTPVPARDPRPLSPPTRIGVPDSPRVFPAPHTPLSSRTRKGAPLLLQLLPPPHAPGLPPPGSPGCHPSPDSR